MIIKEFSHDLQLKNSKQTEDPIILIQQFFIPEDKQRYDEIKYCLQKNVENPFISEIHLLNEKIYSNEELGITSKKIIQYDVKRRLHYSNIFDYVEVINKKCYVVFSNSDIEIDISIYKLNYSLLSSKKLFMGLLRYNKNEQNEIKQYTNRNGIVIGDSQDTWIFHSNFNIQRNHIKIFDFYFGIPGCDNKLLYLLKILGFQILNTPKKIITIHHHNSKERSYNNDNNIIKMPYYFSIPYGYYDRINSPTNFEDNNKLYHYIFEKFTKNKNFIIPRMAGCENVLVKKYYDFFDYYRRQGKNQNIFKDNQLHTYFGKDMIHVLKNNAGIQINEINEINDITIYSKLFLESFKNSDLYFAWTKYEKNYSKYHELVFEKIPRDTLWAFTLDIFHYIHYEPWTLALRGRKILIISSFNESIREKIEIREKIYGIDLFPECSFIFLKPPQTQGTNKSRAFHVELNEFTKKIKNVKDNFDIALVSAGGYGNLICNEIFKMGRSSIYVGGVLQMYFGIYGERWQRERSDIMNMYKNSYWSRPKETERPANYENIEDACYW